MEDVRHHNIEGLSPLNPRPQDQGPAGSAAGAFGGEVAPAQRGKAVHLHQLHLHQLRLPASKPVLIPTAAHPAECSNFNSITSIPQNLETASSGVPDGRQPEAFSPIRVTPPVQPMAKPFRGEKIRGLSWKRGNSCLPEEGGGGPLGGGGLLGGAGPGTPRGPIIPGIMPAPGSPLQAQL